MQEERKPDFTHFACLPFTRLPMKRTLLQVQTKIWESFSYLDLQNNFKANSIHLFHMTITMLTIGNPQKKQALWKFVESKKNIFNQLLKDTVLSLGEIKYYCSWDWKKKCNIISVIYQEVIEDEQYEKVRKVTNELVVGLLSEKLITLDEIKKSYVKKDEVKNVYCCESPHITLFWCWDMAESEMVGNCLRELSNQFKGMKLRCEFLDISTRFKYGGDKFYLPFWRGELEK